MAVDKINVLLPVGRLVGGDLYTPNTTDQDGNPLVIKNGANKGQPRQDFFIAIAIPKTPGVTHWAAEAVPSVPKIGNEQHPGKWGEAIWVAGHKAWPNGQAQAPAFAWKIEDGDSTIPNKKGKRNCDREGYPGHWIVKLGGGFAPKICNKDGSQIIDTVGAVKRGYYVQALITVGSNESQQTPGMYLNHQAVALSGYGQEIVSGPDVGSAGFGGMALPAGASDIPVSTAMTPPASAVPGVPGVPGAVPAAGVPVLGVPGAIPGTAAVPGVPGVPIAPNPGFAANAAGIPGAPGAAAPAVPGVPTPPVHTPTLVMTAKANGQPKEAFLAIPGWTEQLMVEQGYAVMQ